MKTGLFFGSFNPIHTGHLIIANHFAQSFDLEQVWFVVSPHNPFKETADLLGQDHRLKMVQLAIIDNPALSVSDIEFQLPSPSYTIDTLQKLEELYPDKTWALIMGADTAETLPKWKNYEKLVSGYDILIYPRPFYELNTNLLHPNLKLVSDVPLIEISATYIRNAIRSGRNCRYLLADRVYEYIIERELYS